MERYVDRGRGLVGRHCGQDAPASCWLNYDLEGLLWAVREPIELPRRRCGTYLHMIHALEGNCIVLELFSWLKNEAQDLVVHGARISKLPSCWWILRTIPRSLPTVRATPSTFKTISQSIEVLLITFTHRNISILYILFETLCMHN